MRAHLLNVAKCWMFDVRINGIDSVHATSVDCSQLCIVIICVHRGTNKKKTQNKPLLRLPSRKKHTVHTAHIISQLEVAVQDRENFSLLTKKNINMYAPCTWSSFFSNFIIYLYFSWFFFSLVCSAFAPSSHFDINMIGMAFRFGHARECMKWYNCIVHTKRRLSLYVSMCAILTNEFTYGKGCRMQRTER